MQVKQIMRRDFVQADAEESLGGARETMRLGRIRHLLVTRGDALLGVLSYRDLLEWLLVDTPQQGRAERLRISDLMREKPACISPEATLAEAADRMCRYGYGCLPVTSDAGHLVGVLTETDLLRAAYGL